MYDHNRTGSFSLFSLQLVRDVYNLILNDKFNFLIKLKKYKHIFNHIYFVTALNQYEVERNSGLFFFTIYKINK